MADLAWAFVRQFLGHAVHIVLVGGPALDGQLVSFDGRSLWVVTDGEDRFVRLAEVVGMARSARPVTAAVG